MIAEAASAAYLLGVAAVLWCTLRGCDLVTLASAPPQPAGEHEMR